MSTKYQHRVVDIEKEVEATKGHQKFIGTALALLFTQTLLVYGFTTFRSPPCRLESPSGSLALIACLWIFVIGITGLIFVSLSLRKLGAEHTKRDLFDVSESAYLQHGLAEYRDLGRNEKQILKNSRNIDFVHQQGERYTVIFMIISVGLMTAQTCLVIGAVGLMAYLTSFADFSPITQLITGS